MSDNNMTPAALSEYLNRRDVVAVAVFDYDARAHLHDRSEDHREEGTYNTNGDYVGSADVDAMREALTDAGFIPLHYGDNGAPVLYWAGDAAREVIAEDDSHTYYYTCQECAPAYVNGTDGADEDAEPITTMPHDTAHLGEADIYGGYWECYGCGHVTLGPSHVFRSARADY